MRYNEPARGSIACIRCIEQWAHQQSPIFRPWKIARGHLMQYLFDALRCEDCLKPFGESCRRVDTQFGTIHSAQRAQAQFVSALYFLPEATVPDTTIGVFCADRGSGTAGNRYAGAIN